MGTNDSVRRETRNDHLNIWRACTSTRPEGRCWLIGGLGAWNRILYPLQYELIEYSPGKLSLGYLWHVRRDDRRMRAGQEVAWLISWLIENHGCIDDLRVACTVLPRGAIAGPVPAPLILRRPPGKSIRNLDITICEDSPILAPSFCYFPEEAFEELHEIEQLKICCCDAELENALVNLVRRNANSLRWVEIADGTMTWNLVNALGCLTKCESLRVAHSIPHRRSQLDAETIRGLLRSLAGIKKFSLFPFMESGWNISSIADALKTNVSLAVVELHLYESSTSPRELFEALAVNTSVNTLYLGTSWIDGSCVDALKSALTKNTCLLDMSLSAVIDEPCAVSIAQGLSSNATLERLGFKRYVPPMNGMLALCEALRTNTTVKRISFPPFRASLDQRAALAKTLAHGDGYTRVLMPLAEIDLPALSDELTRHTAGPVELGRVDMCCVSNTSLKLLFDALATSKLVRSINVSIEENDPVKVAALCQMLKLNKSINSLSIAMRRDEGQLAQVLTSLEDNMYVTELTVHCSYTGMITVSALSDFIGHNRTITNLQLFCEGSRLFEHAEMFSRAMALNPVILEFRTTEKFLIGLDDKYRIEETLCRNRVALNRAVDFVIKPDKDRRHAENYELFCGRPRFLAYVMKSCGQSESEALSAIASTENFLRDNYLVITGVVRNSVACHPANDAIQCDRLDAHCWRAITRYLKVSDVRG